MLVPAVLAAACTSTEEPAEGTWVALHTNSVGGLPERSLLPMGRLRPDGGWDLPWPGSFGVSRGFHDPMSSVRVDADGFLIPREERADAPVRPGPHWLLPYEAADSGRLRSVAPVDWYTYTASDPVQGRPARANRLLHSDAFCGVWVLGGLEEAHEAETAGLALSRPALRGLSEDDFPRLGETLAAAGFPHQPSDADGGYDYDGDFRNASGRYPRRAVVGLARIREGMDIALVRYEEAGPRFGGHVTTWTLVELRAGKATVVSSFAGRGSGCVPRPAQDRTETLWVALVSEAGGSLLDPIGRRHPDGRWDLPWPDVLVGGELDRSGYLNPWRSSGSGDGSAGWWPLPFQVGSGGRLRIDVPLQWYRYTRLGVVPGTVTHVTLAGRGCNAGWSLGLNPLRAVTYPVRRGVAVALTTPHAVELAEDDVPGLDSIRSTLGLLDRPSRDQGGYRMGDDWYPKREILGLYRLQDDIMIGVVGEYGYEGQSTIVFEVSRDSTRIVSEASGGGC